MKILLVCSIAFWGIINNLYACRTGEDLTEVDIDRSTTRIHNAFCKQSTITPLYEQNAQVGETSSSMEQFYVTYRPSLGLEILKCTNKSLYSLSNKGLFIEGKGHQGLTEGFSPQDIDNNVIKSLQTYQSETQFSPERMTLFFEGMSAGAHRAVETALYTKQHSDTKNYNIIVLRYAGGKTFDDEATINLHKILGKDNIIDFHAEEDLIAKFMDIPDVKSPIGTQITFSAQESQDYQTRVQNKSYTCLDSRIKAYIPLVQGPLGRSMVGMLGISADVVDFLKPSVWEAHQSITYTDLCGKAFAQARKKN